MRHKVVHGMQVSRSKINLNGALIVCVGNSLTAGYLSTDGMTYPYQLSQLDGILGVVAGVQNRGVSSQKTTGMITNYESETKPLLQLADVVVLIAIEMRNHATFPGITNQQVRDSYESYCLKAMSDGFIVISSTYTPSFIENTYESWQLFEANRSLNNAWLRNNYKKFSNMMIDTDDSEYMNELSDTLPVPYTYEIGVWPTISANGKFADGTHCTNDGYAIYAELASNVLINGRY